MNILFLGGNRYFGKKILFQLLKTKHKIFLINRNTSKLKYKKNNLVHIKSDRNNLYKNKNKIKNIFFDVIFDNIRLLKNNFNHYIFTSSIITYLNINDDYEVKENEWHKAKVNKFVNLKYGNYQLKYAINKKKIEHYLINNKNINSTILRIPAVLGKNDFSKKTELLLNFSQNKIKKKFLNDHIQFIFEQDLVKIILKIIFQKTSCSNAFNIANEKIKIKDFYIKLNKIKKNFKKKDNILEHRTFPIPTNSLMNCNKIKKQLKVKFSSIEKGLATII